MVLRRKFLLLQSETATKFLERQIRKLKDQITILQSSRAQMRGIATHLQIEMNSDAIDDLIDNDKVEEETKDLTNQKMDPSKHVKVMQDFPRQSAQLDMKTEMNFDPGDDVIDNDKADKENDDLTNQLYF
ncbi:hypothetical protein P3L10_004131 [Capsicum annuum]